MDKVTIVGIVGGSASGKTRVTNEIFNRIGSKNVVKISMDSYYRGLSTEEEIKNVHNYNFDAPEAFDYDLINKHIQDLKDGKPIDVPIYSFITHQRDQTKTIKVTPKRLVIFEGILLFEKEQTRNMFDLKVFIDATSETRILRRIKRDSIERGRSIESIEEQYEKFVMPAYDKYIQTVKNYADIIIPNNNGNKFIGVDVLCDAIKYRLKLNGNSDDDKK